MVEVDKETLSNIVSERTDKIQSEATEQIKHIQEQTKRELERIVPELMKQIEGASVFKLLDVLEVIRNGGVVKTCDYENTWDNTRWNLGIGSENVFYSDHPTRHLAKGRYRVTLIMEKLPEEAE